MDLKPAQPSIAELYFFPLLSRQNISLNLEIGCTKNNCLLRVVKI
jgi:hypothetical protein